MTDQPYWLPFQARPGGKLIPLGPFATYDEAKREREQIKRQAAITGDYYGVPFVAASKEDAATKVHAF